MNPPTTHPESAWLVTATAPALAAATLLIVALLLRRPLALLVAVARSRLRRPPTHLTIAPALVWTPETLAPERLVAWCLGIALVLAVALALVAPLHLALLLGAPLTGLAGWGLLIAAERRYVAHLEAELTAAVGRLGALLKGGASLRTALEQIAAELPTGPLRAEWSFLLTRQGAPLNDGIATPQQVIAALADQTPSRRHATLLNHLGAAAAQPLDVLTRRCEAAYEALQAIERRRDEVATELAQVRYSGVAVGLAGIGMALYLVWSQWERVVRAYSTPAGILVGLLVIGALCLPIIGGVLLARFEDIDY